MDINIDELSLRSDFKISVNNLFDGVFLVFHYICENQDLCENAVTLK